MTEEKILAEALAEMIENGDWQQVGTVIEEYHPADIADIIDQADSEHRRVIFSLVPDELKPDVLAELEEDAETEIIDSLSVNELSDMLEEMEPDDAADVMADLSSERSELILGLMNAEDSAEVRKLMEYPQDTAGGIMTPDLVAMKEKATVAEALEAIAYVEDGVPFYYAYIVDDDDHLIGYVNIWELLREKQRNRRLSEIVHRDLTRVQVETDQEEVARLMNQYDLSAIPVTDSENRLLGRITLDDVIDVMQEEASEDIFLLAGSDDAELNSTSPLKSCGARLPWLFMTLFGGFITSLILRKFHAQVDDVLILAAFVPIILAMGGNTGIQSSTLVVRRIALGGLRGERISRLMLREITTGAIMGLLCGAIIGAWATYVSSHTGATESLAPFYLGGTVAIALFSAMTFAAMFGTLVPVMLNRLSIDPAVASGPFITITNDISALLIYFGVTLLLLRQLTGG